MGKHPINLAARFLLELSALAILGLWGWHQRHDGLQIVMAVGVPVFAAVLWGVFAVPGDPSRSGSAPVPVPGILRLGLELVFFASATWALDSLEFGRLATIFGVLVALHYAASYDRIQWLLAR